MKGFIYVFVFISRVVFSGCATTGGKLSEADLQRMGIRHGGYGNSN